jgi:hypothetical protein
VRLLGTLPSAYGVVDCRDCLQMRNRPCHYNRWPPLDYSIRWDVADLLVSSLAPYEKRVIELLRNAKDKRARRLAKKRVRRPLNTHSPHLPTVIVASNFLLTLHSSVPSAVRRGRSRR